MNKTNPSSFSDTTLSSPNVKKVVNAIALILENQMKDVFF